MSASEHFRFEDKVVVLISTEKWGDMRNSKHNYALALANQNNQVFFINPPDIKLKKRVHIERNEEGIYIVSYLPVFRGKRFLPDMIFRQLMNFQVVILRTAIRKEIDVVWSFDQRNLTNLNLWHAMHKIFFPADVRINSDGEVAQKADLTISVSDSILRSFQMRTKGSFKIGHALADPFEKLAANILESGPDRSSECKDRYRVGYIGNLLIHSLDHEVFKRIIEEKPNCEFHLWGAYEIEYSNLSGSQDVGTKKFIEFLKQQNNVVLKGSTLPSDICKDLTTMDLFLIIYRRKGNVFFDGSNTHKMLEYFSSGKMVVSSLIDEYEELNESLILMSHNEDNSDLHIIFERALKELGNWNSWDKSEARLHRALQNTYAGNLKEIEKLL